MQPSITADSDNLRLRALTAAVRELAGTELEPAAFLAQFLRNAVGGVKAHAGAIWLCEDRTVSLKCDYRFRETFGKDADPRHDELLTEAITRDTTLVVPSGRVETTEAGDDGESAMVLNRCLVIVPLRNAAEVCALLEIVIHTPADRIAGAVVQFLEELGRSAGDFFARHAARTAAARDADWQKLSQFADRVHRSLDLTETAYLLANDGRQLLNVDRVSVVVGCNTECRVAAVSGQDTIEHRAPATRALRKLTQTCLPAREPVWFTGVETDLPPQIEDAMHEFADETDARAVGVIPLLLPAEHDGAAGVATRPEPVGALILEQFSSTDLPAELPQRLPLVQNHAAIALHNALTHREIFLFPLWKALASWGRITSRKVRWALLLLVLVGGLIGVGSMPADFTVEGPATLQPVERRHVFAQTDGIVSRVRFQDGRPVPPGATLVELRSVEVDVAIARLQGDIAAARERIAAIEGDLLNPREKSDAEREQLHGELAGWKRKRDGLQAELALKQKKRALLVHRNPLNATAEVVTWDAPKLLLDRPVSRGQKLISLANTAGEWELELRLPEDRFGHLKQAQSELGEDLTVDFILPGDAGRRYRGRVVDVRQRADVHKDEGNVVLVRVAVPRDQRPPEAVPGVTVMARVNCGRKSLAYVWGHDLVEFVQSRILFRF